MNPNLKALFTGVAMVCFMAIATFQLPAQTTYFFGDNEKFDTTIPSPQSFLGYDIGSQHSLHANVVHYFKALAQSSNKITFREIGKTHEKRPLIILTITAEENHEKLEQIRKSHVALSNPEANNNPNISASPIVINLGYNVHGNEPSSTEAAMLMAYYLVASNSEVVQNMLSNAIILMDPVLNPDGRDRHSTWVNSHLGSPPVADPLDREHNETWPGGRTNHYWFDLNRDWLPLVHPESQARIKFYHQWLPNIVTDFHEMGTNATYFFEPTKPFGSENPIVPRENYDKLNGLLANYFSAALDSIGSLYFTKEVFDNTYPGYGSTYPDVHGGVGLVFEQASSRGHLQKSTTGEVSFPFTIKNHLNSSIATVKAGVENKTQFLDYQRRFFESSYKDGGNDPVDAYIFGDHYDTNRTFAFLDLLQQHKIKCYGLQKDEIVEGHQFQKGKAFWVPTHQPQYKMVKTRFEKNTQFHDSIFYDASAWAMVFAYGMPHAAVASKNVNLGTVVDQMDHSLYEPVTRSNYSYIIDWRDYNAPMALHYLLENKIIVKAAFKPFSIISTEGIQKEFGYGSLIIPVSLQEQPRDKLYEILKNINTIAKINIVSVNSGRSIKGIDLGSGNFKTIKLPKTLMLVGEGVSSYEAGEVWHLLDQRVKMPITKIDLYDFDRAELKHYDRIVMVSGNYGLLSEQQRLKLDKWIKQGGTLITIRNASSWAIKNKLVKEKLKLPDEPASVQKTRMDYVTADNHYGAKAIGGSIYKADLDISHPLGFGYSNRSIWVYRNSKVLLEPSENLFSTVIKYEGNPLVSGYISDQNLANVKNSASVIVSKKGRGRVILFADNPNFRGTWFGTNKLFTNALFFGDHIDVP